jgi:hypothetical protein
MNLLHKLKETCTAVLPICVIVLLLGTTVAPLGAETLVPFCIGSFFLIIGLSIFLTGADLGIVPAGSFMGAKLTRTRMMPLILGTGLLIGFLITIAEPDLLVLGDQVENVTGGIATIPTIPGRAMVISVALGVGLFVALGLARTLLQIPYRFVLIIGYAITFALASRVDNVFVAIAFDSGGATTGPMTVPFIIALGVGIAAVRGDKNAVEDSFGYTGIASIGPILAVTILGFMLMAGSQDASAAQGAAQGATDIASATAGNAAQPVAAAASAAHEVAATAKPLEVLAEALALIPAEARDVFTALFPLFAIIVAFQFVLLKFPPVFFKRVALGFFYAFLGLVFFFVGTELAFVPAGKALGAALGALPFKWILIPIGVILGAVVVCAEPAVWVLTEQVEEVSGGNIRKPLLLGTLAIGVSVSVGLSMCRVLWGFSIWYLLVPFYALAIALTFFTPKLFTAIAFDSGGVASGPMASTFILSLTLGASVAVGGNPAVDGFGVIAMIAATPLVAIQILGMLYHRTEIRARRGGTK